ncbi:MAG: ferredoxin [Gemmatimonadota bacterium]
MAELVERVVDGLTVRIDRHLCVGFGDCVEEAPSGFELDDEGIAVFHAEFTSLSRDVILAACRSCPVDAITVHDEEGIVVAP